MRTQRRRTASEPTGLIITLLALVALIGLLTGILTRTLISRRTQVGRVTVTASAGAPTTITATPPSPSATVPATTTATAATITSHFQLSVTVSPKTVTAGQQVMITVEAFNPDTHAPIAGLPCVLRAPIDGSPSLFNEWPAGQATNANGAVSWTLTAPTKAAGLYEVEAYAETSKWSWKADSTIRLSAS